MKCEFCAEEIQPEAVVCRFCGARKVGGAWQMPAMSDAPGPQRAPPGTFTLRFAGATFGLSAFLELLSITAAVPMFGALRGGVVAIAYHGVYVALFAALFVGLWQTRRWAYPVLIAATSFYTVDNLRFVLDRKGMHAKFANELTALRGLLDEDAIMRTATISALLFAVCWWLFVLFVRRHRDALTG